MQRAVKNTLSESDWLSGFIAEHRLERAYASTAQQFFLPLAASLADQQRQLGRPMLVAINGCQGSGKSTLAALLVDALTHNHQQHAVALSIDDFYLTRSERAQLADQVHPLLQTRGVPGTHDIELLRYSIGALLAGAAPIVVPRFDKAVDDRAPLAQWHHIGAAPEVIILEGWCIGTGAQCSEALIEPVNELEATRDQDGRWRRYVNQQIRDAYEPFYRAIDVSIMLRAPSFTCVHQWRLEQEIRLDQQLPPDADRSALMNAEQIRTFISFYQRLTEHALRTLAEDVDWLFELDNRRSIVNLEGPGPRKRV